MHVNNVTKLYAYVSYIYARLHGERAKTMVAATHISASTESVHPQTQDRAAVSLHETHTFTRRAVARQVFGIITLVVGLHVFVGFTIVSPRGFGNRWTIQNNFEITLTPLPRGIHTSRSVTVALAVGSSLLNYNTAFAVATTSLAR